MKMLKFGGQGLPPGTHTYYEMRQPNDDPAFVDRVEPGHVVDAARVVRLAADPDDDTPAADEYVARGQAIFIETDPQPAAPEPENDPA